MPRFVTRRSALFLTAAAPFGIATLPRAGLAATPAIYAEGGIAIDGTDAVAYFAQGRPVAGSDTHSVYWNGTTWRFASAENAAAFAATPEDFAPQYGGYCAWAVSQGYTASTVPEAWTIHGGKLYLNFSRRIRRRWERDIDANIAAGNANWPGMLG
jgi:hypothetical protein